MHCISLLDRWLTRNCSFVHKARSKAVVRVVESLVLGGKATVAELGRNLLTDAYEKHGIKCADRLVGNRRLAQERLGIYQAMARWLLGAVGRPWIIIDWSDVELGRGHLMLKAAVPVGGRAISIYEEVHPLRRYNSPKTHRRFLERLHEVVPAHCCPVIITDAGFRGPWFKVVESLGWDWIGRVRNQVKYSRDGSSSWKSTDSMYYRASRKPTFVGRCWLSRRNPYACQLHLYKALTRGPGRPRKHKRAFPNDKRQRLHAREPWLLATSLPCARWSAARVVRAYEKRMQIEETFRDLKSHQWGYALQYTRSNGVERLGNLLLITTLAVLATILVGLVATANRWVRHFQANTETRRPVLSIFFVGRRVLKSRRLQPRPDELSEAAHELPHLINSYVCSV